MTRYYSNHDLDAYEVRVSSYDAVRDAWEAQTAAIQAIYDDQIAAYDEAHDAWEAQPTDPETGEQLPEPQPPPEPTFPADLSGPPPDLPPTFEGREIDEPTEVKTATGPALALPPRVILTAADGTEFALSTTELAAAYTPTTEAKL